MFYLMFVARKNADTAVSETTERGEGKGANE